MWTGVPWVDAALLVWGVSTVVEVAEVAAGGDLSCSYDGPVAPGAPVPGCKGWVGGPDGVPVPPSTLLEQVVENLPTVDQVIDAATPTAVKDAAAAAEAAAAAAAEAAAKTAKVVAVVAVVALGAVVATGAAVVLSNNKKEGARR